MSDKQQKLIRNHIDEYGWHVVKVFGEPDAPPFAYTVGFGPTFGHPEVLIIGLNADLDAMHIVLNNLGHDLKAGRGFKVGQALTHVLPGYRCHLLALKPEAYTEYLGQALDYYGTSKFQALQLVWPSPQHKYPWDADLDPTNAFRQPLAASR